MEELHEDPKIGRYRKKPEPRHTSHFSPLPDPDICGYTRLYLGYV